MRLLLPLRDSYVWIGDATVEIERCADRRYTRAERRAILIPIVDYTYDPVS